MSFDSNTSTSNTSPIESVRLREIIAPYSLPALILAPMAIAFYVFVPKLYADLGTVSVASIGLIVFLTRSWDAIIDPVIGYLSDRTNSRYGRRKPWLALSVFPLCISFVLLFAAADIPASYQLIWFGICSSAFFLFWTMYSIPYEALGQELVRDYDQRTILFSLRDGAAVVGTLIAALTPLGVEYLFADLAVWFRWTIIALCYSFALLAFTVFLLWKLPKGYSAAVAESKNSLIQRFRIAFANEHFKTLIISYCISSFGAALPATLFLFYVEHIIRSDYGAAYLFLYFVVGVVTLPLWWKLSLKIGKKKSWLLALLLNTAGFIGVFFLGEGDEIAYAVLITISGLGYGATLVMPSSMQADVVDIEELKTGERKEGEFLGVWSLAKKTMAALGAGAGLWILGVSGFDANLTMQSENAKLALRMLYCLVPCLCSFTAMLVLLKYSLDRNTHAAALSKLAAIAQQKNVERYS